ncbi:hypothetical protein KUTeg_012336 [Tegillarca granosa]|uniref:Thioredoxin domain-containing protein n=1 Tax=Tegillarca granosa TaxID=220873 RepID=A0ABQ9F1M9_TEGGR|nr:hypothetical protein KUTeg_012336 [Tegillarca granosa]
MKKMAAIEAIVGANLLTKDGLKDTKDVVKDKEVIVNKESAVIFSIFIIKGLYFSAHWCPPCRAFTPVLAEQYTKIKDKGKKFEVIFISSDRDQSAFNEYYNEMPWNALPFTATEQIGKVKQKYAIRGIPTLILLNPDGEIISKDGRSLISDKPDDFPWQ